MLAVAGGNAAGFGAFRAALALTMSLWRSRLSPARPGADLGLTILFIVITAIAFAAPPVLIGALTARLAGHARLWTGLAAGLWSLGFAWWWPDSVPLLGPQAWIGPTVLILLSGLIGGWLMDVRTSVNAFRAAQRS